MKSIDQALEAFQSGAESLLNELWEHVDPYAEAMPDARFADGLRLLAAGMLAARSPQPAKAAVHAPQTDQDETSLAKRFYRLLKIGHRQWLKLLCVDACQVVEASDVDRVIVALDPVNVEKAYARQI